MMGNHGSWHGTVEDASPASLYTLDTRHQAPPLKPRLEQNTMHCWARYLFFAVILILGVGNMVTACGQKGDLYLVDEAQKTEDPYKPASPQGDVPRPPAEPAQQ